MARHEHMQKIPGSIDGTGIFFIKRKFIYFFFNTPFFTRLTSVPLFLSNQSIKSFIINIDGLMDNSNSFLILSIKERAYSICFGLNV
ncbi:hypothetical protein BABA_10591 [Neobacillus bataviensis LMG 21833]|uniref:Uncharacterized protein n=1 Tax=Neobacillus bataviensis LMG 21833 TaxID=1117379 RepID=K6DLW4_9BACI|nr:hypothetical protein BABA_10591 [Neobacillus bataviensis LMG 21833]